LPNQINAVNFAHPVTDIWLEFFSSKL